MLLENSRIIFVDLRNGTFRWYKFKTFLKMKNGKGEIVISLHLTLATVP